MKAIWKLVQTENTSEVYIKLVCGLMRGITAGLFVNKFHIEFPQAENRNTTNIC
jgi:hypothetical protein